MALPSNTLPTYTIKVPSTGENLKFRPFIVADEKALLIAQQSEDDTVILDTMRDVIQSCCKTKSFDATKVASFDLEYIFVQLRSYSIGEQVDIVIKCPKCIDNPKSKAMIRVDLQQVKVNIPEGHTAQFNLFGDVGIRMKYPTIESIKQLQQIELVEVSDVELTFALIADCIDYIYDGEETYPAHEQSPSEIMAFLNGLQHDQFEKIQVFLNTMPSLQLDIPFRCPVCTFETTKTLEGISDFFS